jgi:hypothetical protein
MAIIKTRLIAVLFFSSIFLFYNNFSAYSEAQNKKDLKINLINFNEEEYLEYFIPLLPSTEYNFSRYYTYSDKPSEPAKDTIGFFIGKNQIEGKDFYRISANSIDTKGNAFKLEWDISDGWFLDNRKEEALKFSADTIFESERNDVNTVFSKKLLESKSITELNPLYPEGEVVKQINGYEFAYKLQRSPTYRAVRTSSEILFFCGIGVAQYYYNREENEVDWVYEYKWKDARQKVEDGWYWDPNNFNTNSIYHLYAGLTYYQIARSNYYSIPASVAWTFAGSWFWEFFGEWREQVSLNDMIFTTTLGALTGESLIQTCNYINKTMDPGIGRTIITFVLDPMGWFNRMLDSSNSGDIRVRLVFVNPIQAAIDNKVEKEILNR